MDYRSENLRYSGVGVPMFELFVKKSNVKLLIRVKADISVGEWKSQLSEYFNFPVQSTIYLIFAGRILVDCETLVEVGLTSGLTVHCVVKTAPALSDDSISDGSTDPAGYLQPSTSGIEFSKKRSAHAPKRCRRASKKLVHRALMWILKTDENAVLAALSKRPAIFELLANNNQLIKAFLDSVQHRMLLMSKRAADSEFLRRRDRALSILESTPSGFALLKRRYLEIQEPFSMAVQEQLDSVHQPLYFDRQPPTETRPMRVECCVPMPNPWKDPNNSVLGESSLTEFFQAFIALLSKLSLRHAWIIHEKMRLKTKTFRFSESLSHQGASSSIEGNMKSLESEPASNEPQLPIVNQSSPDFDAFSSKDSETASIALESQYGAQLNQMLSMGFGNREENLQALGEMCGNVEAAVAHLAMGQKWLLATVCWSSASLFTSFFDGTPTQIAFLCLAILAIVLLRGFKDPDIFGVVWRAVLIGVGTGIGLVLVGHRNNPNVQQFGVHLVLVSCFHVSEFVFTSFVAGPEDEISTNSFLLNHSVEYGIASVAALVEFVLELYVIPAWKVNDFCLMLGLCMCLAGETVRKLAIVTAGSNFNHIVQTDKKVGHELITSGIYGLCRHPSYLGWYLWALGTQVVLMNPLCFLAYALISWRFFRSRIECEEVSLLYFFGRRYREYQNRVWSGIPYVSGYVGPHPLVDDDFRITINGCGSVEKNSTCVSMARRSRSFDSDLSDESPPPRRSSRKRSRMDLGRDRSPYSPPPRSYRSPHEEDFYAGPSSRGTYRALCVTHIDEKVSDEILKDALYKEFRRFGDVTIRVMHEPDERIAYITYKSSDDAHYARKNKPRIMFYNKPIVVQPVYESTSASYPRPSSRAYSPLPYDSRAPPSYDGRGGPPPSVPPVDPYRYPPSAYPYESGYRPPPPMPGGGRFPPPMVGRFPPPPGSLIPPGPLGGPGLPPTQRRSLNKKDRFPNYLQHLAPEEDPLATRTLFAGNLDVSISDDEVRRIFGRYGKLEDVDIKRPPPDTGNAYAFLRYENLDMAHQAKISLSGQYIGKFLCKIGYGKPVPTVKVWVGGLGDWCTQQLLESEFDRFGAIKELQYEPGATSAAITYDSIEAAKAAVAAMRGFALGGSQNKIRIDYLHVDGQSDPASGKSGSTSNGGKSEGRSQVPPPPGEEAGGGDYEPVGRDSGVPRGGGHMRGRGMGRGRGLGFPPRPMGGYRPPPVPPMYDPYGIPSHRPPGPPPPPHLVPPPMHGPPPAGPPPHHRHLPPPPPHSMRAHTPPEVEYDHLPRSYRPRSPYSPPRGWSMSPPPPSIHHHHSRRPRSPPPIPRGPERVDDLRIAVDVERVLPVCWEGGIVLKNSIFATKLHMVRGERGAVRGLDQVMKIAQRLRLDPTKLDDVRRRLSMSPGHAVFIGLSTSTPAPPQDDPSIIERPLKHLVGYLKQKDAAGVVSLQTPSGIPTGVVYAFPPCRFSFELLRVSSPHLIEDDDVEDHVVVVMVAGSM
ncbi:unnamed protein product [Notodromas monacha]|uniref:Protein-S-isoprenylcysteine O-methyltransferase n=1 Tax=Notodromas monacha TaxID=399045 RepID=A0A7R9BKJ1_9CRUS|nr:unnamed protein product [Notodromas monacha]CAG0916933.1 unnamed protein product [Notodromas monacha]